MKKIILGLFIFGLTTQAYAQETKIVQLEEVVLVNTNYKYLNSTDADDMPIPVNDLEILAANFDVKTLDVYTDEYEYYDVYFIIPEGKILATYDKDGKIIRTAERFKNVDLPQHIKMSIGKRFPNWTPTKDIYLVNYDEGKEAKKMYKITLENGKKRIKVKVDDKGHFL